MYAAVVLAGGSGRRMGDPAKPAREVGGRRLLDRVLDACHDASQVVVVGPEGAVERPVVWAREDPPGGGPVPALAAGLSAVRAAQVAVLAADLPFLQPRDVLLLRGLAAVSPAGAILVDGAGRPQWLAGVWRTDVLRAALAGYEGDSLRGLFSPLRPCPVAVYARDRPSPWFDCDSPAELASADRSERSSLSGEGPSWLPSGS